MSNGTRVHRRDCDRCTAQANDEDEWREGRGGRGGSAPGELRYPGSFVLCLGSTLHFWLITHTGGRQLNLHWQRGQQQSVGLNVHLHALVCVCAGKVVVDSNNRAFVCDSGNARLQVFRLGLWV